MPITPIRQRAAQTPATSLQTNPLIYHLTANLGCGHLGQIQGRQTRQPGLITVNLDTVRASVRGQLKAIAATDLIVAQAIENAIVAGIGSANGVDMTAEPHSLTEDEVLAMSQDIEASNAKKRAADIKADPSLGVEAPLDVPVAPNEGETVVEEPDDAKPKKAARE